MRHSAAKAILSYWHSIVPEDGGAPGHAALQPRALKSHLPDLFIIERMDRAVFSFKLAGTRMCARYGRELRDHDFIRLWPSAQHGEVLAQLTQALQSAAPVVLKGAAATLDGDVVPFSILLMPIADAEGNVNRLMGAMLTADDRALRQGACLISQSLETAEDTIEDEPVEMLASDVFAQGRETKVAFLRVIDGWKDDRMVDDRRASSAHLAAC
jgi:hypothetical protein